MLLELFMEIPFTYLGDMMAIIDYIVLKSLTKMEALLKVVLKRHLNIARISSIFHTRRHYYNEVDKVLG